MSKKTKSIVYSKLKKEKISILNEIKFVKFDSINNLHVKVNKFYKCITQF